MIDAGKIGHLVVNIPTQFVTANTFIAVARINGVNSTPTITFPKNTTGAMVDNTHFPSVAAGDLISVSGTFDVNDAANSNGKISIGFLENNLMSFYLQTFSGIVANLVEEPDDYAASVNAANDPAHRFVAYDPVAHASVMWGDHHDPVSGKFTCPPLDAEKRQRAHDVLAEAVANFRRDQRMAALGADNAAQAGAVAEKAIAAFVADAAVAATAIDAAKTHHDLPDAVRASVRGYGDGHPAGQHARARRMIAARAAK